MELMELRKEIDQIDDELVRLFCQRMEIAAKIADYKKENGLPICNPLREQEVLLKVAGQAGAEMGTYTQSLYATVFELSRSYQSKRNSPSSPLLKTISDFKTQNTTAR